MRKKMSIMVAMLTVLMMSTTVFAVDAVEGEEVSEPGEGSASVDLTAAPTTFNVTVPMSLPIEVEADGNVVVADNAVITNKSFGAVKVTGATISAPLSDWTIVDYTKEMEKVKVGTKELGFKLNDGVTTGTELTFDASNYQKMDGNGGELKLTYDAVVPAQTEAITEEEIAEIVFTLGWDD